MRCHFQNNVLYSIMALDAVRNMSIHHSCCSYLYLSILFRGIFCNYILFVYGNHTPLPSALLYPRCVYILE